MQQAVFFMLNVILKRMSPTAIVVMKLIFLAWFCCKYSLVQLLLFVINHVAPDVNKQASHNSPQTYSHLGAVITGATCCAKVLCFH